MAPCIFDPSTRGSWVISFMPWLLYPHGKSPLVPIIGSWVGPRGGLDTLVKRIPSPCWNSNPWSSNL